MSGAPVVQFSGVSKTFGDFKAVNRISFEIQKGEFFSILGPSGCGKTTTLRLLAGFEEPDVDGGEVRLLGEVVNTKRPYERQIGMVFQSYALFPHLTVERNVAFGLEQRKTPKSTSRAGCDARWRWCGSRPTRSRGACRRRSPAASGSAWRSRGRWCSTRPFSSSTSRSAPWT